MLRTFTNRTFQLSEQIAHFQAAHPETPILVAGATKVIRTTEAATDLRRGKHWARSARGVLIATSEALVFSATPRMEALHAEASGLPDFGDFTLPLETIAQARLIRFRQGTAQALVLAITTTDQSHYQFGLMPDPAWETQLPFPVITEAQKLGWSRY
ncbi:MAG: hypothetical protein JOZ51_03435, partial [Chloroflexi bacterium]|nr:hypothetical protein [Chloroflexota bacterium]